MEFETLDANHISDLIEHGEMKDPPNPPAPPEIPDEMKKEEAPKESKKSKDEGDDSLPGEIVGAPA